MHKLVSQLVVYRNLPADNLQLSALNLQRVIITAKS